MSADPLATISLDAFVAVFCDYFALDGTSVEGTSRLADDLGFDSLEMLEVLMLLDDVADTTVPVELAASLTTVADVWHWTIVFAQRSSETVA